eukprot:TRINITY_DN39372_c0_g1_i1.p1 TRINITY_DN39372_c0_g1~~TRINITY_DN39372_c0_g1_i1.p1  ORF type:complete len:518 (-),score=91.52 TRINITY_DN39372_c0_g1_i1:75-1628(-)
MRPPAQQSLAAASKASKARAGERRQLRFDHQRQQLPGDGGGGGDRKAYGATSGRPGGGGDEEARTAGDDAAASKAGASASSVRWQDDFYGWLTTSPETDPARLVSLCCEDFKPRKLKAPLVLGWLFVQALGLVFQFSLLMSVGTHLAAYEETLATYCGAEHRRNGVCVGPAWNLSYAGALTFPPSAGDENGRSDFDFVIPSDQSFSFDVRSDPPTFLIGLEPQPPCATAAWTASFAPVGHGGASEPVLTASGPKYKVIASRNSYYSWNSIRRWAVSVNLRSRFPDSCTISVFAVDSAISHLESIHQQQQCSFENSWQNFAEHHSGDHHRVLSNTQTATAFFLLVSLVVVGIVLPRFYYYVEGGKILSRIIALKFVAQDIPQQLCIVGYLYAWYASNGLRCQMCLFHPSHCDSEHPLNWTNLLVCLFTMVSACSNQLLLQAKLKRNYSDEDECFAWFTRFALFSVSILPFSTAIVLLSASLLHLRSVLIYIGFGIPMFVGFASVLCVPLFACCDEDEF